MFCNKTLKICNKTLKICNLCFVINDIKLFRKDNK